MKTAWIPEHPRIALYRAKVPSRTGKLGEMENLLTADANDALQFATEEECWAWILANPVPAFVAREHGWFEPLDRT